MFFLEFYFHDQVALPHNMRAEEAVSYALLPLLLFAALSSVVAGNVRMLRLCDEREREIYFNRTTRV